MFRSVTALAACLALVVAVGARADENEKAATAAMGKAEVPPHLRDFLRTERFGSAKISPDGKYLASTVAGPQDLLVVLSLADNRVVEARRSGVDGGIGTDIAEFHWASDTRLVYRIVIDPGPFTWLRGNYGTWHAVNAVGTEPVALERYEKALQRTFPEFLGTVPGDDRRVLMELVKQGDAGETFSRVAYVDTYTGKVETLVRSPRENCTYVLDRERKPAYAACFDHEDAQGNYQLNTELYRRDGDDWTRVHRSVEERTELTLVGAAPDGRMYALSDDRKGPAAFGLLDRDSGAFQSLFQDPVAEVDDVIVASDGTVLGVVTAAGTPKVTMLDAKHPEARIHASLSRSFPGQFVDLHSATRDGRKLIVSVRSDTNPGDLYLYDRDANEAKFLFPRRDWVDPDAAAKVRPFSFAARDGQVLHGYLTLPPGSDGKGLPLIVNPHGGPFGVRDDWRFDPEAQLFAAHGYAVLKVNFRGSDGFGQAFEDLGHRQWGGTMQDDLTDATRWAIADGVADPARVCIYGISYGGYAALMGAAKEPDLYRCAIGYVGLYDVPLQIRLTDTNNSDLGREYLERTFGKDRAAQAQASPVTHAGRIKAAVFLAAGKLDARTPVENTERMREALERAGHPAEQVIIEKDEGHGFEDEAAVRRLYVAMLAFLDRHIGTKAAAPAAEPTTP